MAVDAEKQRQWQRNYRALHRERINAERRERRQDNLEEERRKARERYHSLTPEQRAQRSRQSRLKCNYGITPEQYASMHDQQDGKCAICGAVSREGKVLAVDHCHKTGQVRKLLCDPCNMGLGHFADDPARLRAAAEYLEAPT